MYYFFGRYFNKKTSVYCKTFIKPHSHQGGTPQKVDGTHMKVSFLP